MASGVLTIRKPRQIPLRVKRNLCRSTDTRLEVPRICQCFAMVIWHWILVLKRYEEYLLSPETDENLNETLYTTASRTLFLNDQSKTCTVQSHHAMVWMLCSHTSDDLLKVSMESLGHCFPSSLGRHRCTFIIWAVKVHIWPAMRQLESTTSTTSIAKTIPPEVTTLMDKWSPLT